MIDLVDISRYRMTRNGPQVLFSRVNLHVDRMDRVGIYAEPSSGKSTLCRIISGIERPDSGTVLRRGSVSWPLGFAGAFHPDMTGAENASMIARLKGDDPARVVAFVVEFGDLREEIDKRLGTFSPAQRARLAYWVSMAFLPDFYVADETISIGGPEMQDRCRALMTERLEGAGLIMMARNATQLERYCSRFFALVNGTLIPTDTAKSAQELYREVAGRAPMQDMDRVEGMME